MYASSDKILKFINLGFIYLANVYWVPAYYVPRNVLGAWEISVNKANLVGKLVPKRKTDNK